MFERQFGLRENPFAAGHQSRFVYPSREHQEALAHLRFGIENREPFVLITGEVGTGKTTALYDVLAEWESRAVVALVTNSALTRDELLEEICLRFGLAVTGSLTKPRALVHLERFLHSVRDRGHRAILLLDEAQNLDRALLEEIRLLSNLEALGDKLIQVFLVGQPELETKLASPELRQLRQRISVHYRLNPLNDEDTERYIHHRISVAGGHAISIFPREACLEVFRVTFGIPREINTVAGQSMLNAFVEDSPMVLPEHVRAVERDTEFRSVLRAHGVPTTTPASPDEGTTAPVANVSAATASVATAPIMTAPAEPAPPAVVPAVAQAAPAETISTAKPGPTPESAPFPDAVALSDPTTGAESPLDEPEMFEHMAASPVQPASSADAWGSWLASLAATEPSAEPEPLAPVTGPNPEAAAAVSSSAMAEFVAEPDAQTESVQEVTETWNASARETADSPLAHVNEGAEREIPVARPPAIEIAEPVDNTASLPPRLRRKLEFEPEPPTGGKLLPWMLGTGIAAVIVVAAVLAVRFGAFRSASATRVAPATMTQAQSAAPAPSAPAPKPAMTPERDQPTPSATAQQSSKPKGGEPSPPVATTTTPAPSAIPIAIANIPKHPAPAPVKSAAATSPSRTETGAATKPSGAPAPSAAAASAAPTTATPKPPAPAPARPAAQRDLFGVAVGTYLNEDRAAEERTKLAASTKLPARLLTVTEDNVAMFRVVMGAFESRVAAERAASNLIEQGLVDEARVVPLAKANPQKP